MSEFLKSLKQPRDLFFKGHNPTAALDIINGYNMEDRSLEELRAVNELKALILRAMGNYGEAIPLYQAIQDDYQAGYCALLMGDIPGMQQYWGRVLNIRQNHWCLTLFGLISLQLRTYPTLFQIRNHLESDIANLIAAKQEMYLRNLLSYIEFLTQLNLETPKFAGRALMHAGRLQEAEPLLLKGQRALPNDPEIYFHLGQLNAMLKRVREARTVLNQCLLITPTYTPAKDLLATLEGASA